MRIRKVFLSLALTLTLTLGFTAVTNADSEVGSEPPGGIRPGTNPAIVVENNSN